MKFVFSSEAQKQNAMDVAQRAGLEACGKIYVYLLDKAEVDTSLVEKVEDESLSEDNIEQIKL